jgi:cellulose synthase/poly-beta-1,6-N-acetylglucosamine synthase-like glycosyltransferase
MYILYVFYLAFLGYIGFTVLYVAVFSAASHTGGTDDSYPAGVTVFRKIGVLIPAYKENAVIVDSIQTNLRQTYPSDRYDMIVIADSIHPDVLAQLATFPIRVFNVSFAVSTVAKAVNEALSRIADDEYDIIVVADADNHMAPDFLDRINTAFSQGWRAVQGHRVAKNTNTSVAVLDAISEEINNTIFRKGSRALGLSASIIGSGMGIEPPLMKQAMAHLQTMGGYDKELEMNLILAGHKIGYLEQAFIYDEKVAQKAVFENQRTRWIAAQWQFLRFYFRRGVAEFANGRLAGGVKFAQALVLPRVLLIGILGICTFLGLFSGDPVIWGFPLLLLTILMVSLITAVPSYLRKRVTVRELLLLPVLMLSFAKAILNMRKAFKSFLPTPHTSSPDQRVP